MPTTKAFNYLIERAAGFTGWSALATMDGTGSSFVHPISLTNGRAFFRCLATPVAP